MSNSSSVALQPLYPPPQLTVLYPMLDNLFTLNSLTDHSDIHIDTIIHVHELSNDLILKQVDQILKSSSIEVAMTLLFSNNTTLLNDSHNKLKNGQKVEAVCIAMNHSSVLHYIVLHLVDAKSHIGNWIRKKLTILLESSKAIGYQMNEVLCTIITHFQLSELSVSKWNIFDVGLAYSLIEQPDTIPPYSQLLIQYNVINQSNTVGVMCLSSIGPLMIQLYHHLTKTNLWHLFIKLEMRIVPLVSAMESYGLLVNESLLKHFLQLLQVKVLEIQQSIYSLVGYSFTINSVQQLRKVLYDDLKLDQITQTRLSKTPVNKYTSTSEATLVILQEYHELPKLILEYRQMCKLRSLIDNINNHISSNQGYLRPCWQSIGTLTGRITSCNPNVQAFPKHPTLLSNGNDPDTSIDIRSAIHSRHNYSFVVSDFKSIELCLLAHVSGDLQLIAVLKNAWSNGSDVFQLLASEWLGMRSECITDKEREKTKRIVYSLIYGMGKEKLSQLLNISLESAQQLTTSFLNKYNKVKEFMTKTIEQCRKTKYCTTLCGRMRKFDNIKSANYVLRTTAERQCINFIIQGSATDVCKISMLKMNQSILDQHINGRLLMQVHDEFVYEIQDTHIEQMILNMKNILESDNLLTDYISNGLQVPLSVRITTGKH